MAHSVLLRPLSGMQRGLAAPPPRPPAPWCRPLASASASAAGAATGPAAALTSRDPAASPPARVASSSRLPTRLRPLRRQSCGGGRRAAVVAGAQKAQFSSFEEMLSQSELPLLVDFYATWCGPCQMMSPTLSSIATKMKGRLQVVKIDTDRYPGIASQHRVQALPTIALFVGGKAVFRFEGVLTEAQLMERLNYYLPQAAAGSSS